MEVLNVGGKVVVIICIDEFGNFIIEGLLLGIYIFCVFMEGFILYID